MEEKTGECKHTERVVDTERCNFSTICDAVLDFTSRSTQGAVAFEFIAIDVRLPLEQMLCHQYQMEADKSQNQME